METATNGARLRETCGLLRDYWYVACTADELGKGTDPVGRVVLGEALVLYRDAAGAVVCLRDRCMHRNTMLSEGAVINGCLKCPYHGWTYDRDGRCVDIPSLRADEKPLPPRLAVVRPLLSRACTPLCSLQLFYRTQGHGP